MHAGANCGEPWSNSKCLQIANTFFYHNFVMPYVLFEHRSHITHSSRLANRIHTYHLCTTHITPSITLITCITPHITIYTIQEQYGFIYNALNEFLLCGDTEILACDLKQKVVEMQTIKAGEYMNSFQKQFKVK